MFLSTTFLTFLALQHLVSAFDIRFCPKNKCDDDNKDDDPCPVTLTSVGHGWPDCEVYESKTVFSNQGFDGTDAGGWNAYIDVEQPDEGCRILVLTPASVDRQGCGAVAAEFSHAACSHIELDKTFMVQYCCGDKCDEAGASQRRDADEIKGTRVMSNGTLVEPFQVGPPMPGKNSRGLDSFQARRVNTNDDEVKKKVARDSPNKDDYKMAGKGDEPKNCKNWQAKEANGYYTTNSDERQIMATEFSGTSSITTERSQSYSSTIEAGLSFEGILNLGTSMSIERSVSSSKSKSFTADKGQTGMVVFTPHLKCSEGWAPCDDMVAVTGEVCTGYRINPDDDKSDVAGTWRFVTTN